MTILFSILFFVLGIFLRPLFTKWIKKHFVNVYFAESKRYEIIFKVEFYNQPSIHHLGEEGILVKSEPIKIQVDADDEDDALDIVDTLVKQEVKAELMAIKEISKV